jgi:hypothetical protein
MRENELAVRPCTNGEEKPRTCYPARHGVRLLCFTLLLGVFTTALGWQVANRRNPQIVRAPLPKSAADLAVLLREKLPEARIVSTRADGQIDRSFLLTVRQTDANTLRSLPRVAERAEQWQGTVLCEWVVNWETAEPFLEQWGAFALALPPFVFFGDRELLQRIEDTLR